MKMTLRQQIRAQLELFQLQDEIQRLVSWFPFVLYSILSSIRFGFLR
jgi:hypothetical protein